MEYLRTYSVKLLQKKIIRTDDIKLSLYSEAMMSIKEKYGMEYTFKDLLKKREAKPKARLKVRIQC